jgi:multiple sugar transport system ATP-binding protein
MAKVLIKDIVKTYENGFQAVKKVSVTAEDKEFVILVGPSGCGKTTTLRMIAGLESITEGEIIIGDKVVNDIPPKNRDIAMVFQNYALYPHMTVYDNMAFALKLRRETKDVIDATVKEAADLLEIGHLLDRKPKELSGGQRQRVALGRAIVRKPKVFLFDEPLSNLDAKLRVQMRAEIIKLHKKLDTTIIYVTHDQVEAMTMADKIVVMKEGEIHQIGAPLEIYNNPINLFVASFLGSPSINILRGKLIKEKKLMFTDGDIKINVTPKPELEKYIDSDIIMGIRPEDIYDADYDAMAEAPQKLETVCDVVEPMGNEFIVFLDSKNSKFVARFDPKRLPVRDEKITVSLDMNRAHFFDPVTEITI